MESPTRRSQTRLAIVGAAIAALVLGAVIWFLAVDGSDDSEAPSDLVIMAQATLTAREAGYVATPTMTPPAVPSPTPATFEEGAPCAVDAVIDGLPPGLPAGGPGNHNWYGSSAAGIWASPVDFGVFLSGSFNDADTLWFAGELMPVLWYGTSQPLEVTGERLGGSATLEKVEFRDALNDTQQWTDIVIPEPGCWQLTGATETNALTITVEVLPATQRPDIRFMRALFDARPYDAPTTCPISSFAGADRGEAGAATRFWLEDDGITVDLNGWFVAGQEQGLAVFGDDLVAGMTGAIRKLDPGIGGEIEVSTTILNSNGRMARFIFPEPGCWELEFVTAASTAIFVVYVYPEECLPTFSDSEILVSCEPPRS